MLVLTQLSVGAFAVEFFLRRLGPILAAALGTSFNLEPAHAAHAIIALGAGLLALGASTLHLGRPQYAFRAIIGIRTSWLSREVLAFGAFAGLAALYAGYVWREALFKLLHLPPLPPALSSPAIANALGGAVVASGIAGVFCSVMLYVKTAREYWSASRTSFRFFASAAVLGMATTAVSLATFAGDTVGARAATAGVAKLLATVAGAKLLWELVVFVHLGDTQLGSLKRTALLLKGELVREAGARLLLGVAGGVALPLLLAQLCLHRGSQGAIVAVALLSFLASVGAELLERVLFFRAASPPRMPGGL
jgi:DMSO reductase anchor subunit